MDRQLVTRENWDDSSILRLLGRYWWVAALAVGVSIALGLLYASSQETRYQATASVIVEDPRASTPFEVTDLGRPSTQASERYLADQVEILRSGEIAKSASERLDDQFSQRYFERNTTVVGDLNSNLIEIGFTAPTPQDAQAGANAIALEYQELRRRQVQATAQVALSKVEALLESIDAEIASLTQLIAAERSGNAAVQELNRQFEQAQDELNNLRLQREEFNIGSPQRDAINARIAELLADFSTWEVVLRLSERGSALENLIAERNAAVEERATLIDRANSIEVDAELAPGGVSLFSEAALPEDSTGLGPPIVVALSAILGLAIAAAVAYYLSLRRWGVGGKDSPRIVLGAPLLAEVPNFDIEGVSATPILTNPASSAAEAFRFAASVVDIRASAQNAKSLMVIAATTGAGRTATVANTGAAAAQDGLSVLLIDADFADQALTAMVVGPSPRLGITHVIDGAAELDEAVTKVRVSPTDFMSVLSGGSPEVEAAQYLRTGRAKAFFDTIADRFDLVLIDGPPLLRVAYGSVLARYADAAIVVVEHETEIAPLEELREHIALIDLPIVGYVYTKSPELSALGSPETRERVSAAAVMDDASAEAQRNPGDPPWPTRPGSRLQAPSESTDDALPDELLDELLEQHSGDHPADSDDGAATADQEIAAAGDLGDGEPETSGEATAMGGEITTEGSPQDPSDLPEGRDESEDASNSTRDRDTDDEGSEGETDIEDTSDPEPDPRSDEENDSPPTDDAAETASDMTPEDENEPDGHSDSSPDDESGSEPPSDVEADVELDEVPASSAPAKGPAAKRTRKRRRS